jgi:hypothetical protein
MKPILFVLVTLLSISTHATDFKTESEAKVFADRLVDLLLQDKFREAFDQAKPYWPMPTIEIDSLVNQIQQQWPIVQKRFGRAIGTEFVRSERIGKSFRRYYYLHKFENHAIYWQIDFYKPEDVWKINSIVFLDQLNVLYESDV